MKNIINIFFVYMILEGVFRKWIFPSFSNQIYFIKDFFLIAIYFLALKKNLIFNSKYSKIFILFITLISLFGFLGYEINKTGIISYFLGLRSYWLFLPLFLIIANVYTKDDLIKFFKLNLYFLFPYFLLILFQAKMPQSSVLNSGFSGTLMNPERPSGFFTYTTQNTYYFIFLFFAFCSYLMDRSFLSNKELILLSLSNFLLISIMVLLKSRAVYLYIFVTIIYCLIFIILSKSKYLLKLKKILIILFISFLSFHFVSTKFFKKEFEYSSVRINTDTYETNALFQDSKNQKIFTMNEDDQKKIEEMCMKISSGCRILNELYFFPAFRKASFTGEGLGSGTAAVAIYNSYNKNGIGMFRLGETENARIVMELGFFIGTFFVLAKFFFVIIMNLFVFFKFRKSNKIFYIPIVVFLSVQILFGPVTYTTSFISFIFWFVMGLLFTNFNEENKNL